MLASLVGGSFRPLNGSLQSCQTDDQCSSYTNQEIQTSLFFFSFLYGFHRLIVPPTDGVSARENSSDCVKRKISCRQRTILSKHFFFFFVAMFISVVLLKLELLYTPGSRLLRSARNLRNDYSGRSNSSRKGSRRHTRLNYLNFIHPFEKHISHPLHYNAYLPFRWLVKVELFKTARARAILSRRKIPGRENLLSQFTKKDASPQKSAAELLNDSIGSYRIVYVPLLTL